MAPLIECVPNFSEGKDAATLGALEEALRSVPRAHLLDRHADRWHNRSVFTIAGAPERVLEAAFRATEVASHCIDLRKHQGVHPRLGATDVVPFVPLGDSSMEITIRLAHRFGQRVGSELQIPVFLYGYAARHVDRVYLPSIRRPQFEGLRDRIGTDPAWTPDFGPERLHPTAGATAVGARTLLVAYNIFLDTEDVAIAKAIATTIRTSSGGLPAVQARGFLVAEQAQVSMNLLDIDVTPPVVVFEAVERAARPYGVAVARSEIIGLIPERAVPARPEQTLRLTEPVESRVLERRIAEVFERG